MRTRSKASALQAWSLLDLYKALTDGDSGAGSATGGPGWPGILHISDSDDAVAEFSVTGSIPRSWTQHLQLVPASELADEDPKEDGSPASAPPTNVVHKARKDMYFLRLPDGDVRLELPNLVHLQRWGIDLPTWKLAGLVLRDDTDDILGLLMAPRDAKTQLLSEMSPASVGQARREKWASQFEGTMRSMLDIGAQWHGISAEDVEIDEDDDILLSRFVHMTLQGDGEDATEKTKEALKRSVAVFRDLLGLAGTSCNPAVWAGADDSDEDEVDFASGDEDLQDVDEPEDSDMEGDLKDELQMLRGDYQAAPKWAPNPRLPM